MGSRKKFSARLLLYAQVVHLQSPLCRMGKKTGGKIKLPLYRYSAVCQVLRKDREGNLSTGFGYRVV